MQSLQDHDQKWDTLLRSKGLKNTYERRCIYREVGKLETHFDAETLSQRFRERGERISRATVYRTLPLLLEAGIIQKSAGNKRKDFFEKINGEERHDHMICLDCGKVTEFHSPHLDNVQENVAKDYGFKPSFRDHRIFGYCAACQQEKEALRGAGI